MPKKSDETAAAEAAEQPKRTIEERLEEVKAKGDAYASELASIIQELNSR